MHRGGRVLVILGLALAVLSGLGVFMVLASAAPAPVEAPTTKLVVAVQPIGERSEIGPDQVGAADWPLKIPTPTGAFGTPADVVGKFSTAAVYPGQPVIDKMLIDKAGLKETHSNAALLLEKGTVAIALPVTVNTAVAQAIQTGDRVDILATFTLKPITDTTQSNAAPDIITHVLLQDVLVLQVGTWPAPAAGKEGAAPTTSGVVTFQLNEQDASVLKYSIENSNGLTLVLRPATDHDLAKPEPVTIDYIVKRFGFKTGVTGP